MEAHGAVVADEVAAVKSIERIMGEEDMSRRGFLALALLVGASPLALISCESSQLQEAQARYDPDYAVAVVKTTGSWRSSYIEYYDADLNPVNSVWYPYAGLDLGLLGDPTPIRGDTLYLIPRGLTGLQDDRKLASLDLLTGEVEEYRIDQTSLGSVAVDDEYCFVTNDLNATGHISRLDRKSREVLYLDLPGVFPGEIIVLEDCVYVFGTDLAGVSDESVLLKYDRNLERLGKTDLTTATGITGAACPTVSQGRYLHFVSSIQPTEDGRGFLDSIYSFDTQNESLELLCELGYETDTLTILAEGGRVYAFSCPTVSEEGYFLIETYDALSGEHLDSKPVDYVPMRGLFRDGLLFVLGAHEIVRYRPEGTELVEEARVPLDSEHGSAEDRTFHYVSAMFAKP